MCVPLLHSIRDWGLREGYGFLRKPILFSAIRTRAVACTCAENGFTQAVALHFLLAPVFPAGSFIFSALQVRGGRDSGEKHAAGHHPSKCWKGAGAQRRRVSSSTGTRRYFSHRSSWFPVSDKNFLPRRWLYTFASPLYSRPYAYLHPRTRGRVYSRPRAWSGGSAAFSCGQPFSDGMIDPSRLV